jgi:hypothetical protein
VTLAALGSWTLEPHCGAVEENNNFWENRVGGHSAKQASGMVKKISFPNPDLTRQLCGEQNAHLQALRNKIGLSVNVRGNEVIQRNRHPEC